VEEHGAMVEFRKKKTFKGDINIFIRLNWTTNSNNIIYKSLSMKNMAFI